MTWMPPTGSFTVDKPNSATFAPSGGWNDKVDVKSPWQTEVAVEPSYQSDEGLKKQFGVELAKAANAFDAACVIAGEDTQKALWISFHWISDPIVLASRDIYLKTLELSPPLDREQLAAKVLALANEKILSPKYGVFVPTVEAKDRIAAFKLYSEILGYTGKVEIDNSITNNNTVNEMVVKLVKADDKPKSTIIEHTPNIKSEIINDAPTPITLKLVSGASR